MAGAVQCLQAMLSTVLSLQGYYFCVKQYALECSRIPMGQTVNSQVRALPPHVGQLWSRECCGAQSCAVSTS